MKKLNKKVAIPLAIVFGIGLVLALTYYAVFSVNVHVNQPISVTGELEQDVECTAGETCIGDGITVSNSGDEDRTVKIVKNYGNGAIGVSYVGQLELTTKNTETWEATEYRKATVIYTLVGEEFNTEVELEEDEVLVYALDHDDRFVNYASVIKVEDIDGDLPFITDWNSNPEPNYCDMNNGFDDYEHCNGAKLWIVKVSDLGTPEDGVYPLSWSDMDEYLYETDLIRYFDNTDNEIVVPAGSFITFYPEFSPDKYLPEDDYAFGFEVQ